jgi:NADH dehydrogenase FAD-containing subunit
MKNRIIIVLAAAALVSIPATCVAASTTAGKAARTEQKAPRAMWKAETLSGKITMVDPARKLVVVQDSSGVPFDMVVSRSTHIKSASGTIGWNDLNSDLNRNASIQFVPERRGDVAQTINVSQ